MDLEYLATVVRLLESGDANATARHTGLGAASVRAQLRDVERWLGGSIAEIDEHGRVRPRDGAQQWLPRARMVLAEAERLRDLVRSSTPLRELRVVASHYLATYLLIERLREFRLAHPDVALRLSVRTELQILSALQQESLRAVGICAPLESPADLEYRRWFSMKWSAVLPPGHQLSDRDQLSLRELADEPLILFEPGSTGRQHLLHAFHRASLEPWIAVQATTTALIVQMVEAGLGVAILPLLPSGRVTDGRAVTVRPVREPIEPIDSGIFVRPQWADDPLVAHLIDWVLATPL